MKSGQLRVWWISNPPRKPFYKEVGTIREAREVLEVLTDYDLYLGEQINSNAGGLEIYQTGTWEEWYDMEGNNITEVIDNDEGSS